MCLALLSNGFASGSEDTSIRLWTNNGQLIRILNGHTDTIWSLAVLNNNNNSLLESAAGDKTIRIWNSIDGKTIQILKGYKF